MNGNLLWSKTYGGSGSEFGFNIQNTADGGYVIAGRTDSYGGGLDCYLIKINATGTIQWSKAFGRSGNDYIMNCYQTPDGGYITSGSSQAVAYSNYDWIITKLDASGSVVWTKCIGSSLDDGCRRMIVTSDGGYLCAGHSRYRNSNSDALVIKLDAVVTFNGLNPMEGLVMKICMLFQKQQMGITSLEDLPIVLAPVILMSSCLSLIPMVMSFGIKSMAVLKQKLF